MITNKYFVLPFLLASVSHSSVCSLWLRPLWKMWYLNILAVCVLGAVAQQISVETPPFDLVDETLTVDYGDVSLSPPGRILPLNGNMDSMNNLLTSIALLAVRCLIYRSCT